MPSINDKALRMMHDFMQRHKHECLNAINGCKSQEEEKTDLSLYDCDTDDNVKKKEKH